MTENLFYCVNALLPVILVILLGNILYKIKFINDVFTSYADKIVFNVALPVYLFNEIYNSDIKNIFNLKLILFSIFGVIALFLILMAAVPIFIKENPSRGAFIQGIFRSNIAILGVPIAGNLYGSEGIQTMALTIPFIIPLYNILAVVVLSVYAEDHSKGKFGTQIKKVFFGIITNPLIIAVAAAFPFLFIRYYNPETIPLFFDKTIAYIANLSTPLALLSLGTTINLKNIKNGLKLSLTASLLKTVAVPLTAVAAAILIGFRNAELVAIFITFAAPTAVSSYIMAKNMKSNYELAAQTVIITTVLCFITIFIGSFILKSFNFI